MAVTFSKVCACMNVVPWLLLNFRQSRAITVIKYSLQASNKVIHLLHL